jgi:hypothetical protein
MPRVPVVVQFVCSFINPLTPINMLRSSPLLSATLVLLLVCTVSASAAPAASSTDVAVDDSLPFPVFQYSWSVEWQLMGVSGTTTVPVVCQRMQNNTSGGELPVNFFSVLFKLEERNLTSTDWQFDLSITLFRDVDDCTGTNSAQVGMSSRSVSDAALQPGSEPLSLIGFEVPTQPDGSDFKGLQGSINNAKIFFPAPDSSSSTGVAPAEEEGRTELQRVSHGALIVSLCVLAAVLLFACVFARRRQQANATAFELRQHALSYSNMA